MSEISAISKVLNKSDLPDELINLIFEYIGNPPSALVGIMGDWIKSSSPIPILKQINNRLDVLPFNTYKLQKLVIDKINIIGKQEGKNALFLCGDYYDLDF